MRRGFGQRTCGVFPACPCQADVKVAEAWFERASPENHDAREP